MFLKYINRIELNTTELCNLKCSFCPRGHGYPNKNKHMTVETASLIREQLNHMGYKKFVSITGRGEPTLTRNFEKILDVMLTDATYKTYMYTNGHSLDKYEQYIHMFWKVYVDVYDVHVDTYQHMVSKYKQHENVTVMHKPDNGTTYQEFNKNTGNRFSNRGGYMQSDNPNFNKPCAFVFNKIFINWNGDYNLCCDDWEKQLVLSNINKQTIAYYVEHNKILQQYRQGHLNNARCTMDVCATCTRDYYLPKKIHDKLTAT